MHRTHPLLSDCVYLCWGTPAALSQLWLTDEALEGSPWVCDRLACVCLALQIPRNMQDFLLSVVAGLLFFPTGLTTSGICHVKQ